MTHNNDLFRQVHAQYYGLEVTIDGELDSSSVATVQFDENQYWIQDSYDEFMTRSSKIGRFWQSKPTLGKSVEGITVYGLNQNYKKIDLAESESKSESEEKNYRLVEQLESLKIFLQLLNLLKIQV